MCSTTKGRVHGMPGTRCTALQGPGAEPGLSQQHPRRSPCSCRAGQGGAGHSPQAWGGPPGHRAPRCATSTALWLTAGHGAGQDRVPNELSARSSRAASGQRHPGDGARGGWGSVLSRGGGSSLGATPGAGDDTQTPCACPRPTASPPALRTRSRARGAPQQQCGGVSPASITLQGRLPLSWSRGG